MQGIPLDSRIRRSLAVTIDDGLTLAFDAEPTSYFPARVSPPQGANGTFDGSPRNGLSPSTLYWRTGPTLDICHRVEMLGSETYELIAKPEPVTLGRQTVGYSAPALAVSQLYPRSAELKELGNEAVIADVECAVFAERESKGQRGSYQDMLCELPPSTWANVDGAPNLELHFSDGSIWKLTEASLSPETPFVSAGIRKAG